MTQRSVLGLPARVAVLYAALSLATLVAYGLFWPHAPVIDGDSPQYLEVAADLADSRIDALHDRSPGYPALLVLTGSTGAPTRALLHVSLLLHVGSLWLLAVVLHASGLHERALALFGILLTLPPYVEPAAYVMTENLAQFTLVAGLCGLVMWLGRRNRVWLIVASVMLGYAGITRPAYQLLPLAIAGLLILPAVVRRLGFPYRVATTAAAVLTAGLIAIVGGLCWWNQSTFGYFGVAPTFGIHLSTKTMTFVERLPDEYATARDILIRERDRQLTRPGGRHHGTQTIWHVRDDLSKALGLPTPALSSYLVRMNLTLIRQAPLEYLEEVGRAFSSYWFPATGPLATFQSPVLRWLWAVLHLGVMLVFFWQAAVVVGLLSSGIAPRWPGSAAAAYVLCGTIVVYTLVLTCFLDIGEPRQRRPTDVLIVAMCFLGVDLWRGLRRSVVTSIGKS